MHSLQSSATGQWFSSGTPVSNKTDRHDITEILLKVALYTITIAHSHIRSTIYTFFFRLFSPGN